MAIPEKEREVSAWVRSADRLQTLRGSSLLDSPRIERLDRLTETVARILETAYALVTLVDEDRQFFLSSYGLDDEVRQNSIEHSFCKYMGTADCPFRVSDAEQDDVVCHLLSVKELNARAYMGVPLRAPNGQVLGSTCVVDTKPRIWTDEEESILKAYNVAITAVVLHHGKWKP